MTTCNLILCFSETGKIYTFNTIFGETNVQIMSKMVHLDS